MKRKMYMGCWQSVTAFLLGCMITLSGKASERTLFDFGWKFMLGNPSGVQTTNFDDQAWRTVGLPHDWSIEGQVNPDNAMGNDGGYYPDGLGWYRKTFTIPAADRGKKMWLYFEGVYERSEVWVNGIKVGGHAYGYSSFYCDITKAVKPDSTNVVAVLADNSQQKNCRWYSGSGIYRHVWLVTANPLRIANDGIFLYTPDIHTVKAQVRLVNDTDSERRVTLRIHIPDVGEQTREMTLPAHSNDVELTETFIVNNPKLWSPNTPNMYEALMTVEADGIVTDRCTQPFGIRTITYSAGSGLLLNGKPIELNGACAHHDNGILGARGYDRADEWRVERLKEAGFNAVRTAHNPPTPSFLDACDRLGLLVIDEAFDGWRDAKNTYDYSTLFDEHWREDVAAMVLRDRNHPSIFCWSTGNEVYERKRLEIVTTSQKLTDEVKRHDPTRPVTSALASWDSDWEIYDPLAATQDIVGYNYLIDKAPSDHERVPSRIIIQTESFPNDAFSNWEMLMNNTYIVGDFVWTGIDYLGESGIGRWWYETDTPGEHYQASLYPWHGAWCGDIDLTGWRKPISHYRSMLHNPDGEKLYLAVREPDGYAGKGKITIGAWAVWPTWESWNWSGHEGKEIEVEVISLYPSVRLYLNDKLIGEQLTDKAHQHKAVFKLPYREGTLRAEAMENGKTIESRTLSTTGKAYAIRATADRNLILADGQDLSFITLEVVDSNGNLVPDADNVLQLKLSGKAAIIGAGNGDLQDITPYTTLTPKAWKGRALVVVKSTRKAGSATLQVTSPGLKKATIRISSRKPSKP